MTSSNLDPDRRSVGSMPADSGNGSTKEKIKEDARDAKREAGSRAREGVRAGQHRIADGADALSDAIDAAASNLDDHDRDGLARYARELSSNLANAAGQLEGRSVDQLAQDAKRLARNNPALFMLGSIAVGFGLSRFFKASADRDDDDEGFVNRTDSTPMDDTFAAEDDSSRPGAQPGQMGVAETSASSPSTRSNGGRDL